MLTRCAFLLAGSDKKEFRNGFSMDRDIGRIRAFLKSSIGGSWRDNHEIRVLQERKSTEVLNIIKSVQVDYAFFYYTGHGFLDNGEQILQVSDESEEGYVRLSDLKFDATKTLLIVNACRTSGLTEYEIDNSFSLVEDDLLQFANDEEYVDPLFFEELQNAEVINTVVFSTMEGDPSAFNNKGSHFTQCLIKACIEWSARNKSDMLDIKCAMDLANGLMKKFHNQRAVIQPDLSSRKYLPFAISK
jgi:hypothetical protein